MNSLFLSLSLFSLYGCGLNTKFDDSEYRPVGASTPLNSDIHTVTETRKTIVKQGTGYKPERKPERKPEAKSEPQPESGSTRYVRPES